MLRLLLWPSAGPILLLLVAVVPAQEVLKLGAAFSLTVQGTGPLTRPGCEMAVEDINIDSGILQNYTLQMDVYDTQGTPSVGLGKFTEHYLLSNQTWVAHIGPGRSVVTTPVSQLAHYYTLPVVSPSSTSPALSDKAQYPYFMRVVGPDDYQGRAWASIAEEFGWRRVGLLSSSESIHFLLAQSFQNRAVELGITVETFLQFDPNPTDQQIEAILRDLESRNLRIIFLACYDSEARTIFRLVGKYKLVGEGYAWIGTDSWVQSGVNLWDLPAGETYPNGNADRELVMENSMGVIATQPAGGVGAAYAAFETRYLNRTGFTEVGTYASFCYDAVYFLAYGLHHFLVDLNDSRLPYDVSFRADLREYLFYNVSFTGVTGFIDLNENGDRIPLYELLNQRSTGASLVAYVEEDSFSLEPDEFIIWMGGTQEVPVDTVNSGGNDNDQTAVISALVVTLVVLCCCGFIVVGLLAAVVVLAVLAIAFAGRTRIIGEPPIVLQDPDYRFIAFASFLRKTPDDNPPVDLEGLLLDLNFTKVWCRMLAREGAADVMHGVVLYFIACSRINELFDVLTMDMLENGDYRVALDNNVSVAYAFRSFGHVYGIKYLFEHLAYMLAEQEMSNKKKVEKRQTQQDDLLETKPGSTAKFDLTSSKPGNSRLASHVTADLSLELDPKSKSRELSVYLNKLQLELVVQKVIESLCGSAHAFPSEMRRVLAEYREKLEEFWHLSPEEVAPLIGSLLCMRFFCPAITLPAQHGLLAEPPVNLRIYILIGKVLNNLGLGKRFTKKDGMKSLNGFLDNNQNRFYHYLMEISTDWFDDDESGEAEGRELSKGVTVPAVVRRRVLVLLWNHIDENAREILRELQHESKQPSRFTGDVPQLSDAIIKFGNLFDVHLDEPTTSSSEEDMDDLYAHVTSMTRKELRKKRRQQRKKLKKANSSEGDTASKHWTGPLRRKKRGRSATRRSSSSEKNRINPHTSSAESGKKTRSPSSGPTPATTPEILSSGAQFIVDPVGSGSLTRAKKDSAGTTKTHVDLEPSRKKRDVGGTSKQKNGGASKSRERREKKHRASLSSASISLSSES